MNTSIYLQLISLNKNHNEHYLRRYVKLVCFFKQRNLKKKKFLHHEHHIVPESFGGLDTNENLVCITPREHFILHHLLYKAFPKSSMVIAFFGMCNGFGHYDGFKITSKVYEKLQIENAERVSEIQKKKVEEGGHNFSGGEISRRTNKKRVAEGIHNWQDKEKARERNLKRVADGTHPWSGPEHNNKRIQNGTHPWQGPEITKKQLENGTHPSQIKKVCPYCNREFGLGQFGRWHGDKCKLKLS